MTTVNEELGPTIADFSRDSRLHWVKRLFFATRPKFFPASVLPVIAGAAWGIKASGQFDPLATALALLAIVLLHAGANVINDVADDRNGSDRYNDNRIYPYTGGSRFIQSEILSAAAMHNWGVGLLLGAVLTGVALFLLKGVFIIWFGIVGIVLGVMYSVAPIELSSRGMGEVAVALAFGVLPITGAAWLQGAQVSTGLLLFSAPIAAWVAAILLANEVPDIKADSAAGKRTLAVRLGSAGSATVYSCWQCLALIAVIGLIIVDALPAYTIVVPLLLVYWAYQAAHMIWSKPSDRNALLTSIEKTLRIHAVGSIWLTLCALSPILF